MNYKISAISKILSTHNESISDFVKKCKIKDAKKIKEFKDCILQWGNGSKDDLKKLCWDIAKEGLEKLKYKK